MIVAGKSQSQKPKISPIGQRPSKAGYVPAVYEVGKTALKSYGYYEQVKPYLPDTYIDKYTYKPHKRISGYIGQKVYSKKPKSAFSSSRKFQQKCGSGRRGCYELNPGY